LRSLGAVSSLARHGWTRMRPQRPASISMIVKAGKPRIANEPSIVDNEV
jgi:hypothetical protein